MPQYQFVLDDPEGTVTVEGTVYRNGDLFNLPKGWGYDSEFSQFVKKVSFSYPTTRRVRNVKTGAWTTEIDMKRVSLPVKLVEEELAVVADDSPPGGDEPNGE